MIEKKITTTLYQTDFSSLNSEEKDLVNRAKNSLEAAYAPYSGFLVGATVLLENREIISGNNQENVAYPSGLCAERVAIFYAGANFPNVKIKTIAITAVSKKFVLSEDSSISLAGSKVKSNSFTYTPALLRVIRIL